MSLVSHISFRRNQFAESSRKTRGFTLIELLVVLAILVIIVALMLPAVRTSREPTRRTQCKNNLKQIGLALHNYHDVYGSFPPAYTVDVEGGRLHSWRTLILPYVDQGPLYQTIDLTKPWDDPVNAKAFGTRIPTYQCPSANFPEGNMTTYLALSGENAAVDGEHARQLDDFANTSRTAIVVDVPVAEAVHWMDPRDIDAGFLTSLTKETPTSHTHGTHALFADGSIKWVGYETPIEERSAMQTLSGSD